jgi:hypothetical protein
MADLYRHFDKDGRLLYVGCSLSALARFERHRASSHWSLAITTMTIERFDSMEKAQEAERQAIINEAPLHNKIIGHSNGGRPRIEDRSKTLAATKPWLAAGMSRSTWYLRQAEKRSGK